MKDQNETFQLQNDKPEPRRKSFGKVKTEEQKPLFSGLNCLPGQMDLFKTDGEQSQ